LNVFSSFAKRTAEIVDKLFVALLSDAKYKASESIKEKGLVCFKASKGMIADYFISSKLSSLPRRAQNFAKNQIESNFYSHLKDGIELLCMLRIKCPEEK
jgi:hypothetical protein